MEDRNRLITYLEGLTSPQVDSLVIRVEGASAEDQPNASVKERIATLVRYVESSAGPKWEAFQAVAAELFPNICQSHSRTAIPPFMVPFPRNPYFVGRKDELEVLEMALMGGGVAAITQVVRGLGGMGKTQTAVEFAYRHRDDYFAVLWTRADDEAALTAGFINIAKAWGLPGAEGQDAAAVVRATREALHQRSGWLLIVDNADAPDILRDFLPLDLPGHRIITSRGEDFRSLGTLEPLRLDPLPEEDALTFFVKSAKLDRNNAAEVAAAIKLTEALGGLPLAMEQAAAYIVKKRRTFKAFLREYTKERKAKGLLHWQPEVGTGRAYDPDSDAYREYLTVWTTWQFNFDAVRAKDSDSADLLTLSAFLAPDAIPLELVRTAFPERFANCETDEDDENACTDLLLPLSDYSLITEDRAERTFSVHRMVQTVLQDRLDETERQEWQARAVNLLNEVLPSPKYDPVGWTQWQRLLPQALTVANGIDTHQTETLEAAYLLNNIGVYLDDRGLYASALPLYQRALAIYEKALGPEHPDTANSVNNLAYLYQALGDYASALPLYQRAIEICEKTIGKEHPTTGIICGNIAACYAAMERIQEALPYYSRSQTIKAEHERRNRRE